MSPEAAVSDARQVLKMQREWLSKKRHEADQLEKLIAFCSDAVGAAELDLESKEKRLADSAPSAVDEPGDAVREGEADMNDPTLSQIAAELPSTFFADRPLSERVQRIVADWRKAVSITNRLEERITEQAAELSTLRAELAAARAENDRLRNDPVAIEKRRITCFMEHDIHKFGELQCDYGRWLREIDEAPAHEAALASQQGGGNAK